MISVLFTTYGSPKGLQKVLWGYEVQTYRDFEVIIAEDGADAEIKKMIDKMRLEVHYPIKHVWHLHKGFRKCEILNKAILVSEGDYVLFAGEIAFPEWILWRFIITIERKAIFSRVALLNCPNGFRRSWIEKKSANNSVFSMNG